MSGVVLIDNKCDINMYYLLTNVNKAANTSKYTRNIVALLSLTSTLIVIRLNRGTDSAYIPVHKIFYQKDKVSKQHYFPSKYFG